MSVSTSRLELDAGNTFIKWRLLTEAGVSASGRWSTSGFTASCLSDCPVAPDEVWLGSVAGSEVNRALTEAVFECWGLIIRQARTQAECAGVRNSYADPSRMGVDRWLAMLAAWHQVKEACCIVDAGSAITVDLLDGEGEHLGGYILPGLRLMQTSLLGRTAEVRVEAELETAALSPGRSTEEAVLHGAHLLLLALAERVAKGVPGYEGRQPVLVTGGDAEVLMGYLEGAQHCPDLVLEGLQWALG